MQNKQDALEGAKDKPFLEIGKIYLCSDGSVRKLTGIEKGFLSYDLGDCDGDMTRVAWQRLSKTYRWQVEKDFSKGVVIQNEKALLELWRREAITGCQSRVKNHASEIEVLEIKIARLQSLNTA